MRHKRIANGELDIGARGIAERHVVTDDTQDEAADDIDDEDENAGDRRVFWEGPSAGFDAGAEGARTMMLVYNLPATEAIYQRSCCSTWTWTKPCSLRPDGRDDMFRRTKHDEPDGAQEARGTEAPTSVTSGARSPAAGDRDRTAARAVGRHDEDLILQRAAVVGHGRIAVVDTDKGAIEIEVFNVHSGAADKVKAAALKAVPGATVVRVETDSGSATYEAHVTTFAVLPSWRRKGVGARLMLALMVSGLAKGRDQFAQHGLSLGLVVRK